MTQPQSPVPLLSADHLSQQQPSRATLLCALDNPRSGVLIFDTDLNLLHATQSVCRCLNLDGGTFHGQTVQTLLQSSTLLPDSVAKAMKQICDTRDGREMENFVSTLQMRDKRHNLTLAVRSLGTSEFAATFEAGLQADVQTTVAQPKVQENDTLTGIASRDAFEDAVAQVFAKSEPPGIALMLMDLDRFKAVNDTLGHAAGDALLKLAAQRLQSAVRATDTVARFGGDEFAVLLNPSSSRDEPSRVGQRILDLVQRTYMIEGQLVNVGISIGIAQSPQDGTDCKALLRSADLALYHSKGSGRAMFQFFDVSMEKRAMERRAHELELRRALALRQFELHYQPQVDSPPGRLVGFEALVRWKHPERGLIPPALFLPLAEEIGMIVSIGDWVLRTACREATKWPAEITVAVNASPLQFDAGNFADSVRQALEITGLPGERLEIEITEGILLRNDEVVLKTLNELRGMKVRIAMDDFGTGYASLSQLARFPFDKIKIDKSLAGFQGDDLKQRAIVRAITALGQSLGVCTLAEGVETAEQLVRLQKDGCGSVQGYLFGKPLPADQLKDVISNFF